MIFKNHFRPHLKTSYSYFTRYYICMKLIGTFGRSTRQRYEKQHQYFSRKFERGRFVRPFNMHTDSIGGSQFWSSGLATRWTHVWVQFFFLNPRYIFTFTILLSSSHHSHNEERRDEGALTSMICRSTIPKISNAAHFLPEAVIVTLELGKTICRYSQLKESQKCKEEQSIVRKT